MSINLFCKLKKIKIVIIFTCVICGEYYLCDMCKLNGYSRSQTNISISAVGSWGHTLSKGDYFFVSADMLTENGPFCCLFNFIFLKIS